MEKYEVRDIIDEVIKRTLQYKDCPVCKDSVPMIKIYRETDDSYITLFRCLGCLKLYKEELVEV